MMQVKIYINEECIDVVTAINESGPLNGICEYSVCSKLFGVLGTISHNRPAGAHALAEKMMNMANTHRKDNVCADKACTKPVRMGETMTVHDGKVYHADCYYNRKMKGD